MDYNAYENWVMSSATGPGTFLTAVYQAPASQAICNAMANPTNGAVPKICRPPDANMVVDSLQTGIEMWGTDQDGTTAAACFDSLGFNVNGQDFSTKATFKPECTPGPSFCLDETQSPCAGPSFCLPGEPVPEEPCKDRATIRAVSLPADCGVYPQTLELIADCPDGKTVVQWYQETPATPLAIINATGNTATITLVEHSDQPYQFGAYCE